MKIHIFRVCLKTKKFRKTVFGRQTPIFRFHFSECPAKIYWVYSNYWKTVIYEPPGFREKIKVQWKIQKRASNVWNSGRTFEIPAELSRFRYHDFLCFPDLSPLTNHASKQACIHVFGHPLLHWDLTLRHWPSGTMHIDIKATFGIMLRPPL